MIVQDLHDSIVHTQVDLWVGLLWLYNSCNVTFSDDALCLPHSGKAVKKEPGNEEGQQHFDDADKLLQEFQEAQVDRVGSRPSSNLSSLSNTSERDQHHLGTCRQSER